MQQEQKRKDYTFWRQFNDKPSIIPAAQVHAAMHDLSFCQHVCPLDAHLTRLSVTMQCHLPVGSRPMLQLEVYTPA